MLHAKNGRLTWKDGTMDFIRFGHGKRVLVMLPGVGDGLKTVKGMALPFAFLYRKMAKKLTVFVFSRREPLLPGTTTREMAADLDRAMEQLGLSDVTVLGVSQGGMIAQWLAIDHPERVKRLILAVTLGRPNGTVRSVIRRWLSMADRGDYKGILLDTAERSYSPGRIRRARLQYRLIGNLGKPESFERFRIEAASCVTHDAWDELDGIRCPTLVIGGTEDKIVTGRASEELAEKIPGSRLLMFPGLGHGLYEEAEEFNRIVTAFCR